MAACAQLQMPLQSAHYSPATPLSCHQMTASNEIVNASNMAPSTGCQLRAGANATRGASSNSSASQSEQAATRGSPLTAVQSKVATESFLKTKKLTVVLDMDECLLHSKFHGPGAATEAYRQMEDRPDEVAEVNSFWVGLDDGDTAQVNKRPGLDAFLEAVAADYNTVLFTAAMPDYAGPVLDTIDPQGKLLHKRLFRDSCRQVKGAFLKDLSVLSHDKDIDLSRVVLVDNNPLSFICQPTNGILVTSFYDDRTDTALQSVLQLIRCLDRASDVRPMLKDMFRLDQLLADYRTALFDESPNPADSEGEDDEVDMDQDDLVDPCSPLAASSRPEQSCDYSDYEEGVGARGAGVVAGCVKVECMDM